MYQLVDKFLNFLQVLAITLITAVVAYPNPYTRCVFFDWLEVWVDTVWCTLQALVQQNLCDTKIVVVLQDELE